MAKKDKDIAEELYSKHKAEKRDEYPDEILSKEYKIFKFKKTRATRLYEKFAQFSGRMFKYPVEKGKKEKYDDIFESLDFAVTAEDAMSFSLLLLLFSLFFGIIMFVISIMFGIAIIGLGIFGYVYYSNYPKKLMELRKSKASTEFILSILYIVIYMKTVPNLEAAIKFASDNLEGPLGADFKKMIWDVSTKKYADMQEALDDYIGQWKEENEAFVDAIYLIETSLVQVSEERRLNLLDQALDRILTGTYEKMVHYTNDLRTPISALFMLGITLPIMGLVMLPIVGAFLGELISSTALFIFYNILLPLVVLIMMIQILANRPSAFPQVDLSNHPDAPPEGKFNFFGTYVDAKIPAALTFISLTIPFLLYWIFWRTPMPSEADVFYSLFLILAIGMSIVVYAKLSTSTRVKLRREIKGVENDFEYAVFQIGNRLFEGVPSEVALMKTAKTMKQSKVEGFIKRIALNISKLGMDLRRAIFDKKYGALIHYPSSLIKSVMKIFIESTEESEKVAAASLMHVGRYLQSVHRIEEKIKDVLSETLSTLKFQAAFIAPLIAGIIVGLTSMIMIILSVLGEKIEGVIGGMQAPGVGAPVGGSMAFGFFEMSNAIPLYIFQIVVGLYLIQITIISSVLGSKIEFGDDTINELDSIQKYLLIAIIIYFFVTLGVTIAFGGMARIAIAIGEFA